MTYILYSKKRKIIQEEKSNLLKRVYFLKIKRNFSNFLHFCAFFNPKIMLYLILRENEAGND